MKMLRLCTNQSCRLFDVPTSKEEWDKCKDACPGCGRRSCDLISEVDWEKKNKSNDLSEQDKALPSRIKQERRSRPRIKFVQIGAVLAFITVVIIIASIIYTSGVDKSQVSATQTLAAAMTQMALANPTATATPVPTEIPATAIPVLTESTPIVPQVSTPMIALTAEANMILIILSVVVLVCVIRERIKAGYGYQAWVAIILGLVVVWVGSWKFIREAETPNSPVPWIVVICCTVFTLGFTLFSYDPERKTLVFQYDGSALALYATIIWLFGGVFLSDLGFLQDLLKLPADSSVVAYTEFSEAINHGYGATVGFSKVVYYGFALTVLLYGYEVIKPAETRQFHTGGFFLSILGIAAFWALARWGSLLPKDLGKVLSTPLGVILVWIIINILFVSIFMSSSPHSENWDAVRIRFFRGQIMIASPYDMIALQAICIVGYLVSTGTIHGIIHFI